MATKTLEMLAAEAEKANRDAVMAVELAKQAWQALESALPSYLATGATAKKHAAHHAWVHLKGRGEEGKG